MRGAVLLGAVVIAAGALAGAAQAADPAANFAGTGESWSGDCRGQNANLSGSRNTVTIHGGCRYFQIAGNDNHVLVDMAANGIIKVFGSNNEVSWKSPGEVIITKLGPGNVIVRAP
jgi:uncharacterized protein with LGFP repeats